jgi:hypothetical protein
MSLRQLGASSPFGAPGANGTGVMRPPRATHIAIYTYPCPNEEWPVPAGYGIRSHVLVRFVDQRNRPALPANAVPVANVIGEIDFTTSTDLYGQPIRLPTDCGSVDILDGGAVGSTAVVRGRAFWFEERADG